MVSACEACGKPTNEPGLLERKDAWTFVIGGVVVNVLCSSCLELSKTAPRMLASMWRRRNEMPAQTQELMVIEVVDLEGTTVHRSIHESRPEAGVVHHKLLREARKRGHHVRCWDLFGKEKMKEV